LEEEEAQMANGIAFGRCRGGSEEDQGGSRRSQEALVSSVVETNRECQNALKAD